MSLLHIGPLWPNADPQVKPALLLPRKGNPSQEGSWIVAESPIHRLRPPLHILRMINLAPFALSQATVHSRPSILVHVTRALAMPTPHLHWAFYTGCTIFQASEPTPIVCYSAPWLGQLYQCRDACLGRAKLCT